MIRAFHQPLALDEALALVAKGGTPLAGATALYTTKAARDLSIVDIKRLGLDGIAVQNERIVIGATASLTRLAARDDLPGAAGELLRRAARALGSRALRNAITVGGNIVHLAYWADMPVVLLALAAEIEVRRQGAKPARTPLAAAIATRAAPWKGGLLTRIVVPVLGPEWSCGYERFSRTSNDYALATVCALARRDGEVTREARVVVGALQGRPVRATAVEAMLEGERPSTSLIAAAAAELAGSVRIAPNFRADADYRRKLAGVLCRRALARALPWARED